jgi:hypothetical protein
MAKFSQKVYENTASILCEKVTEYRNDFQIGMSSNPVDEVVVNNANAKIFALRELADNFAGEYQADNVKFDHDRFMTACGFPVVRK